MDRRTFLTGSAAALAAFPMLREEAVAYERCGQTHWGRACEAGIALDRLPSVYAAQSMSQWCWAASISMIFRYYGFDLPQEDIVEAVYGGRVNLPALSGARISQQLNRRWIDRRGRRFSPRMTGLFDADAGVSALNNAQIVGSLARERPLLLGNRTHAVVLTAVAYVPTMAGPRVLNIGVLDPWPGVGMRGAQSPAELVPMPLGGDLRYLALPSVRPA